MAPHDLNLSHDDLIRLSDEVLAARGAVRGIWLVAPLTWVFQTRHQGEYAYFNVCCEPRWARLHLATGKPDAIDADAFTMLMRKWLVPSRFLGAQPAEGDRRVTLTFDRDGELFRLELETSKKWANLTLVKDEVVLGTGAYPARIRRHEPWTPAPGHVSTHMHVLESIPSRQASSWLEAEAVRRIQVDAEEAIQRNVETQLRAALKRLRKRDAAILKDLARIDSCEELRRRGELLNSAHGQVKTGARSVRVVDYWDPNLGTVEIPLDPARTLQGNIDAAFKEYRRLKNARQKVEDRWLETQALIEQIETLQQTWQSSQDPSFVENSLRKMRLWTVSQRTPERQTASRLPFRKFITPRGSTVLVGRGARENDQLTTKHARGRDLWLHARDVPGSHVVLKVEKNAEHDGRDLLDAALLAAWFSKARTDTLVDVMWTQAKHVRKPKGAAAGSVSVAGSANITVRMDTERIESILATEVQENEKAR